MGLPQGEEAQGLPQEEIGKESPSQTAQTMGKTLDWPPEVFHRERAQEPQLWRPPRGAIPPNWGKLSGKCADEI